MATVPVSVAAVVVTEVGGAVVAVGGPPAVRTTSWGGFAPASRELKLTPSVDVVARSKLNVPAPVTNGVTSSCTQLLGGAVASVDSAAVVRAGRVFQVMPVSVQPLPVP